MIHRLEANLLQISSSPARPRRADTRCWGHVDRRTRGQRSGDRLEAVLAGPGAKEAAGGVEFAGVECENLQVTSILVLDGRSECD